MERITIKHNDLLREVIGRTPQFPRYTTQLLNLANRNAQGTRPRVVGQMTDLIQEFNGKSFDEWVAWYQARKPNAIDAATDLVYNMLLKLKDAIAQIDRAMVREWVEDLVLAKTFVGLCFQETILARIAAIKGASYRLATPEEEARGIDGYIDEQAVSIKPSTYKTQAMVRERLEAALIFYDKQPDGIAFEFDF